MVVQLSSRAIDDAYCTDSSPIVRSMWAAMRGADFDPSVGSNKDRDLPRYVIPAITDIMIRNEYRPSLLKTALGDLRFVLELVMQRNLVDGTAQYPWIDGWHGRCVEPRRSVTAFSPKSVTMMVKSDEIFATFTDAARKIAEVVVTSPLASLGSLNPSIPVTLQNANIDRRVYNALDYLLNCCAQNVGERFMPYIGSTGLPQTVYSLTTHIPPVRRTKSLRPSQRSADVLTLHGRHPKVVPLLSSNVSSKRKHSVGDEDSSHPRKAVKVSKHAKAVKLAGRSKVLNKEDEFRQITDDMIEHLGDNQSEPDLADDEQPGDDYKPMELSTADLLAMRPVSNVDDAFARKPFGTLDWQAECHVGRVYRTIPRGRVGRVPTSTKPPRTTLRLDEVYDEPAHIISAASTESSAPLPHNEAEPMDEDTEPAPEDPTDELTQAEGYDSNEDQEMDELVEPSEEQSSERPLDNEDDTTTTHTDDHPPMPEPGQRRSLSSPVRGISHSYYNTLNLFSAFGRPPKPSAR
jgi:hypothetical protein